MFGRGTRDRVTGKAVRVAARGAGKAARGTGKAAFGAGKAGLKSGTARSAARGAGKVALKGGKAGARRVTGSRESFGRRFLKYGFFTIAGFAVGALVTRSGEKEVGTDSSSFTGGTGQHTPDPDSPAGRRGETWGSGTPVGTAGVTAGAAASDLLREDQNVAEPPFQHPEEPHRTGTERDYSDPSSGPLIGRDHEDVARPPGMPEQHEEVENRIRTRVGEDQRTSGMPHLNVEVNGDVAEIRGNAPSEDAKQAVTEIAQEVEGVEEVRNLMIVDPQDQTGGGPTPGTQAPDRP